MIRWNGKNWIPAGIKPVIGKRRGAPVPGRPNARWVAGWVGGLGEPADPTACDFTFSPIFPPSPTPTSTVTPTPSITPSVTVTPTPTPSIPSGDADATAYLNAVVVAGGTVDATISAATQTLFLDLKDEGLYSKLDVFYPFVGGTAASHAINAKGNTSYDITWNGGLTHDVSGTTGNGTNGYGDLNFQIGTITNNEASFGLYKNKDVSSYNGAYDMGILDGAGSTTYLLIGTANDASFNRYYWNSLQAISPPSDTKGMWIVSSTGTTGSYETQNGVVFDSITTSSVTSNPKDFFIFTYNNNGNNNRPKNNGRYSFVFVSSDSLSLSESSTLSTIINDFQTSLGRNTYS